MHAPTRVGRLRRVCGGGLGLALVLACSPQSGTVSLRITDAQTGERTPARVEILDAKGRSHTAPNALLVSRECALPPLPDWAAAAETLRRSRDIENPHTGTRQFYLAEPATLRLPPGRYRLRVAKGIEYETAEREFEVRPDQTTHLAVALPRWIDFPSRGWVAADGHLHITRRNDSDDRRIGSWMAAEDLQVANLLQMGNADQFGVTPQYAFGAAGVHREDGTLLVAGQEHPRTHAFGHVIVMGPDRAIDARGSYAAYRPFFRRAVAAGGVAGFAHWGLGPARDGLAIDGPSGLVSFVEVLQFEYPHYEVWYDLLNAGIRIAPVAGTDFPCGPWSLPGRERFYTKIDGPLDRDTWREGVRQGRTFVTNGPLLEFEIEFARVDDTLRVDEPRPTRRVVGIGEELRLAEPDTVRFVGAVNFDPTRDDVRRLELVRNGEVVLGVSERLAPGVIAFDATREVAESGWYALRASGDKVGETPLEPQGLPDWVEELAANVAAGASLAEREAFAEARSVRPSAAHTAPIYVVVGDALRAIPPHAAASARAWLARLDAIEASLADDRIDDLAIWDVPYGDGVPAAALRRDRPAILEALRDARAYYESLAE